MIKKFFEYSNNLDLHYLALDWDDNILHMGTKIHLDHHVDGKVEHVQVSTAKFAEIRSNPEYKIRPDSFSEFRDFGPRGDNAFLEDMIEAIQLENYGPSWDAFIKYLASGTIFAIITARGHEPESIKKGIEWIIDNVLSEDEQFNLYAHCLKFSYLFRADYDKYPRIPRGQISKTDLVQDYLDSCDFYCVSSDSFIKKFGMGDSYNPEKGKELAIKAFADKVDSFGKKLQAKKVSLGFSDDDLKNVQHIDKIFKKELALTYAMNLTIFDTSNRAIKGGVKTKYIPGQEGLQEAHSSWGVNGHGLESSVLPFTSWNAMTKSLYPSTADAPKDDAHNNFKNKVGQVGDLTKGIKKN
jgi:hypothetical protein